MLSSDSSYIYSERTNAANNIYFPPEDYILENKIIKNETKQKKEEIVQNINEILSLIEKGNIYEITGEDFTVLIKPTNSTYLESTTHINFVQCEEKLRKTLNIPKSQILTFFQL